MWWVAGLRALIMNQQQQEQQQQHWQVPLL
jgi:hypothetical protein